MSEESYRHPFVSYLEKHADDRAMLADLRRGLGRDVGEVSGMFPYVVPFVRNYYEEDTLYLIASLFALHPTSAHGGNMGEHLRQYAGVVGDDTATTRRFVQLLRQHRDALDAPLRQHISLLKSKDVAVNWHQLIRDLLGWDYPSRSVQKQWAKAYWQAQKSETPNA